MRGIKKVSIVLVLFLIPFLSACGALSQRVSGTAPTVESKEPDVEVSLEPGEGIGGGALEPEDIGTAIQLTLEAALGFTSTPEPPTATNTSEPVDIEPTNSPTVPGVQFTQLANTLTAIAVQSTPGTPTPEPTAEAPTSEPQATDDVASPTATQTASGGTATPTLNPTQQALAQSPCLALRFITDVTIPDGTPLQPGSTFFKSWYVQNVGSCRWERDFRLVFQSGAALGARDSYDLGTTVNPGQFVTLTAQMSAPTTSGYHTSFWGLMDENGTFFGWSGDNNQTFTQPFYVTIFVLGSSQSNPGGGSGSPGVVTTAPPFTPGP